jgi:(2R)-sulfolactate sulfo-lyase subunit alpha
MSGTDFLVHATSDTVGVVVTEDAVSGKELTGWIMETDATLTIRAMDDIPLGHKIALSDIEKGETILKYGQDIGKAIADIRQGQHAHVHNLKTKRW